MVSEIVNDAREQISFRQIEQGIEHVNSTVVQLKKFVGIFLSNLTPEIVTKIGDLCQKILKRI